MTRHEALSKAIMTLIYFQAHFCKSKEAVDNTQAIIDALEQIEQEPCEDAISREAVLAFIKDCTIDLGYVNGTNKVLGVIMEMPSVKPKARVGHCKDCKYFEYDSVAKVDGIPLIVAHEICSKWADGCKTKEDGYCFLFEPKESEEV